MSVLTVEQTAHELEERMGDSTILLGWPSTFRLAAPSFAESLSKTAFRSSRSDGNRLVPRGLAEKTLGFDLAETRVEINRNEEWMRQRELTSDGRRKPVGEYAEEMDAIAARALDE